MIRTGIGYDVHRLSSGRKLIVGGEEIPFAKGLLGHSDADVLLHALMDAILGALSEGDIGRHFPDTDERYKGISSRVLLRHVCSLMQNKGYTINNIDAIIVAQQPKMMPYLDRMRKNIANDLQITEELINIKATTTEGLGFVGCGEGIAAWANVLIKKVGYNPD